MKETIKAECGSCAATGVYRGFTEPKGVGVVCLNCAGTGMQTIEYVPFTQLKQRTDVETVQRSRSSLIATGVGPVGYSISYAAFLRGERP